MEDILIKTDIIPEWITKKHFKGQELVSIEDLFAVIEDLDEELDKVKYDFEEYKSYVADNYKFMPVEEQIGYDRATW